MTVARLAGRAAGGSTGQGFPFVIAGTVCCWSGGLWQGADPVPGGGDVGGPRPDGLDAQAALPAAAGESGGGVPDAVAQGLGLDPGQVAVQGEQPEPGQQDRGGQRGGLP